MSFGEALRTAIKGARKTQTWLAEELGVRGGTVTDWVQDRALPSGDYMVRLPELLNCSGHWLLTGEGPMRPGSDGDAYRLHVIGEIAEGQVSPTTLRMIEELRRLESLGATAEEIGESMDRLRSDANARAES